MSVFKILPQIKGPRKKKNMTCIVNLKDSHHLSLHIIQTPFNTEGTRISVDCEGPDNALFKVKLLWNYEYIKKNK